MSERDTPGDGDEFDGWRVRWSSRRRRTDRWGDLYEPVLVLTKAGRLSVEVKGETAIARDVMLAHGMVSAMLCDAHFARQWGDEHEANRWEIKADQWRQVVKLRTHAAAVQRAGARLMAGPAGAGARGRF